MLGTSFSFLLAATGLQLPVSAATDGYNNAKTVDVAIIGAGISGLSAAKNLVAAKKSVLVLEARNRVGGRVYNAPLPNGAGVTGVGAEFVGPTQDHVLALVAELGLKTFPTYNDGQSVLWHNSSRTTYDAAATGGLPPVNDESLAQVAQAIGLIDTMAAELDVHTPWTHPKAQEWDSITFSSWLDAVTTLAPARFLLDVATTSIFSAQPRELSLLYTLAYLAAAGNETVPGAIERAIATAGGAQDSRVDGGTQLIAIKLAERLGKQGLALNSPVRRIEKQSNGVYAIFTDAGLKIKARNVVVAMSPPLAARITYRPLLPASRDQLTQRMPMGALGKAIALYPTPFWRAAGLNGQVISDSGTVRSTFDNSPADASHGSMMGFIEADEMRLMDGKTEAEIIAEVTKDYVNYFGPQAANATGWVIQRWDNEEFSRGGPVAVAPPGVLTQYGPALTKSFEGIHFAGTESSPYWTGYMDGAIRSGERVAKEILGTS